ncbi:alpha/beta hydrolase [Candidatus Saccharibacteria bacterium]|nr:alpha/beta hydrolase [Candidatus Saccharibacteria bacterium]
MIEKKTIIDDLLVTYLDSGGQKNVVLMLHGWGDSAFTFQDISKNLTKNFRTVCINLPGFGGSDKPRSVWGLDDYSQVVSKFIAKLRIEPYSIIGHSNGGAIAIRGVANGNLRCSKLILIAASGVRDIYQGKKKVLRMAAKAAKVVVAPLPSKTKEKLKKRAYRTIGSDMFVAEDMQETFKKIVTDDVQSDATKIKVQTLLIYGSKDEATPVKFGRLFAAKITNSKLEVVDDANHFVFNDKPEQVVDLIKDFLV